MIKLSISEYLNNNINKNENNCRQSNKQYDWLIHQINPVISFVMVSIVLVLA